MANHLSMAEVQTILTLHKSGHSNREIARLVGVRRETVTRYLAKAGSQNRPNAPPGSGGDHSQAGARTFCTTNLARSGAGARVQRELLQRATIRNTPQKKE